MDRTWDFYSHNVGSIPTRRTKLNLKFMSGSHNAGKGTNRRQYDMDAYLSSPYWNKKKDIKKDNKEKVDEKPKQESKSGQ